MPKSVQGIVATQPVTANGLEAEALDIERYTSMR